MAKSDSQYQRIGTLVPAATVAVPTYKAEQMLNQDILMSAYEFKVTDSNAEHALISGIHMKTGGNVEIDTFDRAIVAQLMALPQDIQLPIMIKVVQFGRYYALE